MNNISILIVDDHEDTRSIIRTILQAKGYQTTEAVNGKDALSVLSNFKPSLILLDVMMPEMSGFEVVTRLRMRPETQSIPVIMLTAKGEDEDIMSGYNDYQVDYYITKPFTPKHLLNGIEMVLANVSNEK
ncbi:MAG TPA: response regulator [Oligoflexia bacterium]|nr:response regulator [Oligoflexia bacterium]HMP47291.1 response regulator [Oligoflexia bacterium]